MIHLNELMKHSNFCVKQRVLLLLLFIIFSTIAWASDTKDSGEYAQAVVTVDPSAAGKVYVDTLSVAKEPGDGKMGATVTSVPIQGKEFTVWGTSIATYNDITFNLYAKQEDDGYIWAGWYEENSETLYSSDMTTTVTITAISQDKTKPTSKTYVAKWLQPKVTNVDNVEIDFGEINDPTAPIEAESVVYTIADYMGKDNYVMEADAPFIHTDADDPIDETNNQYTSTISYTPTGIHGEVSGKAILASTLYVNGKKYTNDHQAVNLYINEDYTPEFTAQNTSAANPYNFGIVALGASGESTTALHTSDNNYAASVLSTTANPKYGRATWTYTFDEFSLSGKSAKDYFSIKEGTGDAGKPTVVFNSGTDVSVYGLTAEAEGEVVVTVRMGIQCTYYDANNKPQKSSIQYSYLKVIVKKENTSVMEFNDGVSGDFGEVTMGELPTLDLGMYISYVDFEDVACDMSGDGAELFKVSDKPENGKVTVQLSNQWEKFSGCDEHTATLTVTGTRARPGKLGEQVGEPVIATITISATLILGKTPIVVAAGGNKIVTFTWNKIAGAKYYDFYYKIGTDKNYTKIEIKEGEDVKNLTSNETQYTYSVRHSSNGSEYVTSGYVVAKVDNKTNYTITNEHQISPATKCIRISPIESAEPELAWILSTNAANSGIKTGIEGVTKPSDIPNATYRDVNVSSAFDAEGKPLFDRLYIFGETNSANTFTRVYVYEKAIDAEKRGYKYVTYIPNVQSTRSDILTIDATSYSSLYFTGYCPKAGTGFSNSAGDGVIHVKGGFKTLNIYIEDLQVYAKNNEKKTELTDTDLTQITSDDNNYYARGKGSVFVFESSSVNDASPFIVKMHIRGDNVMDAAKGATYTIAVQKSKRDVLRDNPQHYSSPICVLPVATGGVNQRTSLILDDVWPMESHTCGRLTLLEKDDASNNQQGISIDLGNAGTTLAIEGGQYSFLPIAAAYRTTHYSVAGDDFSTLINTYGLMGKSPTSAVGDVSHTGLINASKSIALNDGTFSSSAAIKWYAQSLTVDGGSYNQVIEHYTANASKATEIRNKDGKKLYRATVEYNDTYGTGEGNDKAGITNFAKMVEDLYPDAGINIKATNNENREYHYPLSAYYVGGKSYGCKSLTLDNNKLYLMVPWLDCKSLYLPWRFCSPTLIADVNGTKMPLGGSLERVAGCPDHADSHYTVDRLLYMQIDSYTQNSLDNYYLYGANVSIDLDGEKLYGTINDVADYTIQDKVYMLMPIEAARWTLFTPPFNVANVYVIESYPENQLVKDHGGKRGKIPTDRIVEARAAQAQRLMDLYVYWYQEEIGVGEPSDFFDANSTTDITGDEVPEPYGKFVLDWMAYEKQNHKGNTTGDYTPIIEKLIHFTGKKGSYPEGKTWLNANYYLYKANEWALNEDGNFRTNWGTVTVAHDGAPIMSKGQVYALQFPYNSINGVHDPSTTWDYWTGKYLLIESTVGPHTINGSNADIMPTTDLIGNSAVLIGNASFAEVEATPADGTQLFAIEKIKVGEGGNNTGRDIHELDAKDNATLYPAEGALLAKIQAPSSMRARTINYQTGEVTYETIEGEDDNNDPGIGTGIPTIMGDVSLLVVPTEEGITIIPRTAQRVMLFAADGKMLFNEHLSAEEHINVPTGVYIVRGEYEQVKAIKK